MSDGLVPVDTLARMSGTEVEDAFNYDNNDDSILR